MEENQIPKLHQEKLEKIKNLAEELFGADTQILLAIGVPSDDPKLKTMAMCVDGSPAFLTEVVTRLLGGGNAHVIKIPLNELPKEIFPKIKPTDIN